MASTLNKRKFWIDTDCGVDDAHAILMALAQPDVDVIGISTVHGNATAKKSANNVARVLQVAGKQEIPVFVGVEKSLVGDTGDSSFFHGKDGLGDTPDSKSPTNVTIKNEHAIGAFTEALHEYPGEVSVIALGPLTNLALAIRLDPQLGQLMRHLYIMGGNYAAVGNITICAEYNFHCDPEAAKVVLGEIQCPVTLICWETCTSMGIPWNNYHQMCRLKTAKSDFFHAITQFSLKNYYAKATLPDDSRIEFFEPADQVAVAVAMQPDIVTSSKSRRVRIELSGTETRGQMLVDWQDWHLKDGPKINVVISINKQRFLNMSKDCLK